jgi:hypothetical protein
LFEGLRQIRTRQHAHTLDVRLVPDAQDLQRESIRT